MQPTQHFTFKEGASAQLVFYGNVEIREVDHIDTECQLALPMNESQPLRRVVIESPFSTSNGYSVMSNTDYAWKCVRDSINRGEAPYASHLFYTRVLDDDIASERTLGMEAGFLWGEGAHTVAVYLDRGLSRGMIEGIMRAHRRGANIEYRRIEA